MPQKKQNEIVVAKKVSDAAAKYYNDQEDRYSRYLSWEHCYKSFYIARLGKQEADCDYLSLHLAFYLASWGMYRGSSFLLNRNYKIHTHIVQILLEKKYDYLFGISCSEIKKAREDISILGERIKNEYKELLNSSNDCNDDVLPSDTLITKILLGTLGCVPAYDRCFCTAVRAHKDAIGVSGVFTPDSINKLSDFYINNSDLFEETRKRFLIDGQLKYPQMKVLDMGFWQIGHDAEVHAKMIAKKHEN